MWSSCLGGSIATKLSAGMEERGDEVGPSEQRSPGAACWPSDFVEKFGSVSLDSKEENLRNKEPSENEIHDRLPCQTASQILWKTGTLSDPIPNGFYSVVAVSTIKFLLVSI